MLPSQPQRCQGMWVVVIIILVTDRKVFDLVIKIEKWPSTNLSKVGEEEKCVSITRTVCTVGQGERVQSFFFLSVLSQCLFCQLMGDAADDNDGTKMYSYKRIKWLCILLATITVPDHISDDNCISPVATGWQQKCCLIYELIRIVKFCPLSKIENTERS